MPESRQDFWRHRDQWPIDRTGQYLFLLDVLDQVGQAKFGSTWAELSDYFYRRSLALFPSSQQDADDIDRNEAHRILTNSKVSYVPNWIEDYIPDGDERKLLGTGRYEFSDQDWSYVVSAPIPLVPVEKGYESYRQSIQTFEVTVDLLVTACAKGDLVTAVKGFYSGTLEPFHKDNWNHDFSYIIPRFAFGEVQIPPGPSAPLSTWWETNQRGDSHWIFIEKSSFESWFASQGLITAASQKHASAAAVNRVKYKLIELRKAGPQMAAKAKYLAVAMKKYGLTEPQAEDAWADAAKALPSEHWSRGGRRPKVKSTDEIDF